MTDEPPERSDRRLRWRPLAYDIDHGDESQRRMELPFVVAVLAYLSGTPAEPLPPFRDRKFMRVDTDNLEALMLSSRPHLTFTVPNLLGEGEPQLAIDLEFKSLDDFGPERVGRRVEAVRHLLELRAKFASLEVRMEVRPEVSLAFESLLNDREFVDRLQKLTRATKAEEEGIDGGASQAIYNKIGETSANYFKEISFTNRELFEIILTFRKARFDQPETETLSFAIFVSNLIADIDRRLSLQLNEIMHHPDFQELEATWRGLAYLARRTETGALLKLRVLNVTKRELSRDLERAVELNQTQIFKRLYDEEAYVFGGEPYSLVLCDYFVSHRPEDVSLLSELAKLGAAISAPVLLGADPNLFTLESWEELSRPRDLGMILSTIEHASWRSLREQDDAANLFLVLPRLLARRPCDTREDIASYGFAFVEDTIERRSFLWMNGAFGVAVVITNSFARDRWCADLRGPSAGRVDGLQAHHIIENNEILEVVGPTEIDISDRRHAELEQLGLTPLLRHRSGEFAVLLTPRSLARPKGISSVADPERARLMQLEHTLCVGRITQAVRSFLRDSSGSLADWDAVVQAMREWLLSYSRPPEPDDQQGTASGAGLTHPFRKVEVRARGHEGYSQGPNIEVELELNYLPRGTSIARVVIVPPPGVISERLIP